MNAHTPPSPPELPWADRLVWTNIDCGAGWFALLTDLDRDLRALWSDYRVAQVKEKFGGLRFYLDGLEGTTPAQAEAVRARIAEAEVTASRTCEWCGEPGGLRTPQGWALTLCGACATMADRGERPSQD